MGLFVELKRRNVFRVGIAYIIVSWLIMQVADVVLDNITAPDWVFQVILLVLALGFPLALIFAWAFEITPEGIKKEKDVDRTQSITHNTGRKLDFVIIGVLAVALGYYVLDDLRTEDASPGSAVVEQSESATLDTADDTDIVDKSIAVLPFVNMSSDKEQEWFADGLTEEVLNALTKARDLLVAARTSSFKYKGTTEEISEIARQLGVAHILEGSVRKGTDRIRVTAQLIRAEDGFHLWSETYDREEADVISIQEDLALAIAKALKTAMDPEALAAMMSAGTRSVPAYEAYLEGLAIDNKSSATGDLSLILFAYEKYEEARELDPDFSAAHWEAASYWNSQIIPTQMKDDVEGSFTQFRSYFDERIDLAIATARDPVDASNYQAAKASVDFRQTEKIRLLESYLEERPLDANVWGALALTYSESSDYTNAKRAAAEIERLAGNDSEVLTGAIIASLWALDFEAAARTSRHAMEKVPGDAFMAYQAHRALLWGGHVDEARTLIPAIETSDLGARSIRTSLLRQACVEGRRSDAEKIYREEVEEGEYTTEYLMLMTLGENDKADKLLVSQHDPSWPTKMTNWLLYPYFDPSSHPDLVNLMKRENINRPPPVEIPFACPPAE